MCTCIRHPYTNTQQTKQTETDDVKTKERKTMRGGNRGHHRGRTQTYRGVFGWGETWGEIKKKRQRKGRGGETNTQWLLFWSLWICGCCGERKRERKRTIEDEGVCYVPSGLVYHKVRERRGKRGGRKLREEREVWKGRCHLSLVSYCWDIVLCEVKRGLDFVYFLLFALFRHSDRTGSGASSRQRNTPLQRSEWVTVTSQCSQLLKLRVHQEPLLTAVFPDVHESPP